eukprot:gb/GFBE01027604.1/.p1 GENE.gb/GFBE01027604.1/~~gb/GFBE01027604.1/.p1  ORF type:complete len:292 (+),score=41.92 gb/GFBE01027604.1/:1-876(+)
MGCAASARSVQVAPFSQVCPGDDAGTAAFEARNARCKASNDCASLPKADVPQVNVEDVSPDPQSVERPVIDSSHSIQQEVAPPPPPEAREEDPTPPAEARDEEQPEALAPPKLQEEPDPGARQAPPRGRVEEMLSAFLSDDDEEDGAKEDAVGPKQTDCTLGAQESQGTNREEKTPNCSDSVLNKEHKLVPEPEGLVTFNSMKYTPEPGDFEQGHPIPPCVPTHMKHLRRLDRHLHSYAKFPEVFQEVVGKKRATADKRRRRQERQDRMERRIEAIRQENDTLPADASKSG